MSFDAFASSWLGFSSDEGRRQFRIAREELIDAAIQLYAKSPDKVRRLIISAASPGLTAFADAFRLRKD